VEERRKPLGRGFTSSRVPSEKGGKFRRKNEGERGLYWEKSIAIRKGEKGTKKGIPGSHQKRRGRTGKARRVT